ncbi:hypothetical protein [Streptomyces platensis]|uniref:hypothetical protein n=1 Tax=Streptomyces platensis TaxID=58346 RepID=UPI002E264CE7
MAGLVMMLVFGALGVLFGIPVWHGRRAAVMVDRAGVWLDNGKARQIIPWEVLAGVGMQWSQFGRRVKQYSIELCPSGPIDDRDPVLWALVRDEEPVGPGLPRLRYRLPIPARQSGAGDDGGPAVRPAAPLAGRGTARTRPSRPPGPEPAPQRLKTGARSAKTPESRTPHTSVRGQRRRLGRTDVRRAVRRSLSPPSGRVLRRR